MPRYFGMIIAVRIGVSTVSIVRDAIFSVENANHSIRDPKVVGSEMKLIKEHEVCTVLNPDTCVVDPFAQETTVTSRCGIYRLSANEWYEKDLRSIGRMSKDDLPSSSIADFDGVQWNTHIENISLN